MATITTKYSIGDVVYKAGTSTVGRRHQCPDCLGKKKWKATSPAGTEYEFSCPRCSSSYQSDCDLSLEYSEFAPSVSRLTIGSVQYNSASGSWDHGARYMCCETGVGSGSVYDEKDLFLTEDEAMEASKIMAAEQNKTTNWVVVQYNKSLRISDYQLDNAKMALAQDVKSRSESMIWNIGDLFNQIEEADGKDAILEAVEDYKRYDWGRDKAKACPSLSTHEGRSE